MVLTSWKILFSDQNTETEDQGLKSHPWFGRLYRRTGATSLARI